MRASCSGSTGRPSARIVSTCSHAVDDLHERHGIYSVAERQDPQTLSTTAIELSSVPSMSNREAAKFFVKIAEEDCSKPCPLDFEFTCLQVGTTIA